jgi:hypothetical protein
MLKSIIANFARDEAALSGRPGHARDVHPYLHFVTNAGSRLAWALLFALLLTAIEAYGFSEDQTLRRIGFWTAMMTVWLAVFSSTMAILNLTQAQRWTPASRTMLGVVLALTPIVFVSQYGAHGVLTWPGPWDALLHIFQVVLTVGVFETTYGGADRWMHRRLRRGWRARRETPVALSPGCQLEERLPLAIRGPVVCLGMEDHYVRVHTSRGSTLLLMRLADALAELGPDSGLRVHRSWWVATDEVAEIIKSPRSMRVRLRSGLVAPVSRPYMRALQDLGEKQNIRMSPAA